MLTKIFCLLIVCTSYSSNLLAETYIRNYTYKASEADSKLTSRVIALDQVKTLLLQEIGTHVRQKINITKDSTGSTYASEDVEAITAGLTKVDILEEKWDGETYYLKAKIEADTDHVLKALEEFKKEKLEGSLQLHEALKNNQLALNKAREEVAQLKSQLSQQGKSKTEVDKLVVKYMHTVNNMSSYGMVNKGYSHIQNIQEYQPSDALLWFQSAAEKGNVYAQFFLGVMYETGRGVSQDNAQAVHWFRKGAEQGEAMSQYNLGVMYVSGRGVSQDNAQAVYWFRKGAEQGMAMAQLNLGTMYKTGRGVSQDYAQAVHWFRKGAEQGYAAAQFSLGLSYAFGRGVIQDDPLTVHWVRKAAEQDDYYAQYFLGSMYRTGDGIKQDKIKAQKWLKKSCNAGYKDACP